MKKHIALLLCLVMVLSCLAGCGDSGNDQTTKAPETNAPGTDAPEGTTDADEQTTVAGEQLGELPLVKEETTITIGVRQSPNTEDYETNEYTKWIEEQTGLNLDFVYFANDKTEAVTQLNLMISGKQELPDILWGFTGISSSLMYELGEDEYFVDITDYFSDYGYWFWEAMEKVPESDQAKILQYGTDPNNGAVYAFPRYSEGGVDNCNTLAQINTEWLAAVGEEMPTTVDELYTVLKKFATEDPNGNGKQDEMALVGYESGYRTDIVQFIINAYVYCCDTNVFNATDGKVWVPYTTDEYRQAMIYLNKLYSEKLLTPLFYSISEKAELLALCSPADKVAVAGVTGSHPTLHWEKDNEVLYQYAALAPLEGATDLGGYAPLRGSTYEYNTFITCDAEDPVLCFKLLDFMTSYDSILRMRFGVYGEDWEYADEGTYSSTGVKAAVKVLNADAYSAQGNRTWHDVRATIVHSGATANQWTDDGSWAANRSKLSAACYQSYVNGERPAEVIGTLVYNSEENETVSEIRDQIEDYIAEARALFISGVMDPNDDAQWNNYLANLKAQGMDQWLAIAQSAYTRMTAK